MINDVFGEREIAGFICKSTCTCTFLESEEIWADMIKQHEQNSF